MVVLDSLIFILQLKSATQGTIHSSTIAHFIQKEKHRKVFSIFVSKVNE